MVLRPEAKIDRRSFGMDLAGVVREQFVSVLADVAIGQVALESRHYRSLVQLPFQPSPWSLTCPKMDPATHAITRKYDIPTSIDVRPWVPV